MVDDKAVFMIGWEYPPHNSGGLGVACEGLTKGLADQGKKIYFTLPYQHPTSINHLQLVGCYDPTWFETSDNQPPFAAYAPLATASVKKNQPLKWAVDELHALPQSELELRVSKYAEKVSNAASHVLDEFDLVHAHDWMSFPAASQIKKTLKKPFIAHIHSTEFDRIPSGYGSQYIMQTEYQGLQMADKVIAVSHYTKQLLITRYGISRDKIVVVHNGINPLSPELSPTPTFAPEQPVIVFMGRLTMQKGAEYFLSLANQVLQKLPEALFVVAGDGDQYHALLLKNAQQNLSAHVLFSGFVRDQEREWLLNRADVFVMPSVSEPFGLVALEAAQRQTPVIVSKNSGVAEVLPSSIVADFWDLNKMSEAVVKLAKDQDFRHQVVTSQLKDLTEISWENTASRIRQVYQQL
jgi:glycosyltransferase involved in cell wall biosynthesis